jgi:hypothetical protein
MIMGGVEIPIRLGINYNKNVRVGARSNGIEYAVMV